MDLQCSSGSRHHGTGWNEEITIMTSLLAFISFWATMSAPFWACLMILNQYRIYRYTLDRNLFLAPPASRPDVLVDVGERREGEGGGGEKDAKQETGTSTTTARGGGGGGRRRRRRRIPATMSSFIILEENERERWVMLAILLISLLLTGAITVVLALIDHKQGLSVSSSWRCFLPTGVYQPMIAVTFSVLLCVGSAAVVGTLGLETRHVEDVEVGIAEMRGGIIGTVWEGEGGGGGGGGAEGQRNEEAEGKEKNKDEQMKEQGEQEEEEEEEEEKEEEKEEEEKEEEEKEEEEEEEEEEASNGGVGSRGMVVLRKLSRSQIDMNAALDVVRKRIRNRSFSSSTSLKDLEGPYYRTNHHSHHHSRRRCRRHVRECCSSGSKKKKKKTKGTQHSNRNDDDDDVQLRLRRPEEGSMKNSSTRGKRDDDRNWYSSHSDCSSSSSNIRSWSSRSGKRNHSGSSNFRGGGVISVSSVEGLSVSVGTEEIDAMMGSVRPTTRPGMVEATKRARRRKAFEVLRGEGVGWGSGKRGGGAEGRSSQSQFSGFGIGLVDAEHLSPSLSSSSSSSFIPLMSTVAETTCYQQEEEQEEEEEEEEGEEEEEDDTLSENSLLFDEELEAVLEDATRKAPPSPHDSFPSILAISFYFATTMLLSLFLFFTHWFTQGNEKSDDDDHTGIVAEFEFILGLLHSLLGFFMALCFVGSGSVAYRVGLAVRSLCGIEEGRVMGKIN